MVMLFNVVETCLQKETLILELVHEFGVKYMSARLDFKVFRKYAGKFIARRDLEVLEVADDFEELLDKLRSKGVDPRYVIIDYVPEEPVYYLV